MPWNDNDQNGPWGKGPAGPGKDPKQKFNDDEIDVLIRQSQERIKRFFPGGGRGKKGQPGGRKFWGIIAGIIALLWLGSGVYTVNTKEQAVILRFGEYTRTTNPGLNYHLPFPIESRVVKSVTDRYTTNILSNQDTYSSSSRSRYTRTTDKKISMLTGDENIVDMNLLEVQWQISDVKNFLFNVQNPEKTIRDAAESAMREVVGTTPLNDILSEDREVVQQRTKRLLQEVLDSYDIGVDVSVVNMRGVPPTTSISVQTIITNDEGAFETQTITTTVDEAFKDVQAAIINREEIINTAIAQRNEVIPRARGEAERMLQEAQGYKEQVIAQAEGEAKRFLSVFNVYRGAKDVTKKRIYLETMEQILAGMDKIILDSNGTQGVVPYLPLNELKKRN